MLGDGLDRHRGEEWHGAARSVTRGWVGVSGSVSGAGAVQSGLSHGHGWE